MYIPPKTRRKASIRTLRRSYPDPDSDHSCLTEFNASFTRTIGQSELLWLTFGNEGGSSFLGAWDDEMGPGNQGRQFWDPFLSYKYGEVADR